jgi:glycine cleavage system H protein
MIPNDCKYTEDHEWVRLENDIATIGITNYAAEELGEIVFAELPEIGTEIGQGDEFGSVESVKTVSSLFLPLAGTIVENNQELVDSPGLINSSSFDVGWFTKVKISDTAEYEDLMTSDEYKTYLETL